MQRSLSSLNFAKKNLITVLWRRVKLKSHPSTIDFFQPAAIVRKGLIQLCKRACVKTKCLLYGGVAGQIKKASIHFFKLGVIEMLSIRRSSKAIKQFETRAESSEIIHRLVKNISAVKRYNVQMT